MKTSFSICVKLPIIKRTDHSLTRRVTQQHEEPIDEENQVAQVHALDQWNIKSQRTNIKNCRKVTAIKSSSIIHHDLKRSSILLCSIMQAKLDLARLENELKKADQIDYNSIYKNIEYCSGMYEAVYNLILKTFIKSNIALTLIHTQINNEVQQERLEHITNLEKINSKDNYKERISLIRESIEKKQSQLEPIQSIIDSLQIAKIRVLKHCLGLGHDVRDEGLIWILRELAYTPKIEEFPVFLNEKQIRFITTRYQRQLENHLPHSPTIKRSQPITNSQPNDTCNTIQPRRKKRQISMINQGAILQELQNAYLGSINQQKHRLLSKDILNLAAKELPQIKATKYEVIYKQTLKKLNKFCINQIYKKNKENKRKDNYSRKKLPTTIKILSLQQKCSYSKNESYISQQERQLNQIIRNLKYQSYQQTQKYTNPRNIVSIICCLIGWKKAKKLIEQEMGYLF